MFVIKPTSGFITLDNLFISPFLSIPTSKMPIFVFLSIWNREIGTPYWLLNEFLENIVLVIWEKDWPIKFLVDVFPAEPVIAIA